MNDGAAAIAAAKTVREAPWTADEQAEFAAELTALNLRRCKFAAIAGAMIAAWSSVLSAMMPELRLADLREWLGVTLALYGVLLAVRSRVMRPGVSEAVRQAYVLAFVVALIAICDGFFFVLSEQLTAVSSFSRGMLVTAVIFVLPPRRYLPVLVVNELLLCAWLAWRGVSAPTVMAFLDGTAGAVVAGFGSWVLFRAKRADFWQQRQIRRQHAEMNELMAITAHDLRSPLFSVKNLLTLAATRPGLDRARLLAVIADAARACERMLGLVSELVTAHAAEQDVPSRMERGDLRTALAAAVERARTAAETKGVRVTARAPDAAALAMFDAAALAQVLDNLVGNAVKFSPAGATVEASLAAVDGGWRMEIADEGPGVPEAERARLFQKYTRGTAAPTGGEGGSGLGLFIAKTLAERMGARVNFEPRAPQGARFTVTIPGENAAADASR